MYVILINDYSKYHKENIRMTFSNPDFKINLFFQGLNLRILALEPGRKEYFAR